jgi:hypothetical protein
VTFAVPCLFIWVKLCSCAHALTYTHTHSHTHKHTPSGQKKEECDVTNQFEIFRNRLTLYSHLNADAANGEVFAAL